MRYVYRHQNSYHNFEHALDVLQAIHMFLHSAGRVPPASILLDSDIRTWKPKPSEGEPPLVHCLTPADLFCLYVASIGHDVGHPGVTNNFMVSCSSFLLSLNLSYSQSTKKNAQAPLSSLYDHNSPLEQLHYTLLLHILRRQGFSFLLDNPHSTPHFRKLLAETVLATDMRVHSHFMERFRRMVHGADVDLWTRRVLVCQALIKAADISNPVIGLLPRPYLLLNDNSVSPDQCLPTLGIRPPGRMDITGHS
jgi:3'5'-cyclic nucleotide phosphodiesterase